MKKFTFKSVLDGFRAPVQAPTRPEQEIQETLRPEHFQVKKTFRHGFPFSPTALAWDPIQKLLAIGDKGGNLRILGGPGVDSHVRHEPAEAVLHCRFLINEGGIVTATADDQLHLWTFRQKFPQRVQSLKFQRERITCLHIPLGSKWVHVGTERGNVHVVNIETFALSGYVINWNKAIEVTRPNHPGAVVDLSENPIDASKLVIAFESGLVVVWDLRLRAAEWRASLGGAGEGLRAAAWQHDGKLMTAHLNGALATWTTRGPRPVALTYPHAKVGKDGKLEFCKPIHRLEWKTSKTGESLVIFSGGLPTDKGDKTHSITVLNGKSTTVLEMEHSVVDFITLCESPYAAEYQEPYAIVVLLQSDLVVIDLLSPGYPCFENPYPMDIHESPVTCCSYFADCPSDLIPALYSVGRASTRAAGGAGGGRAALSARLWPVAGGAWAPASCSYNEIILTGHADGSVKFWDASAGTLQILYKLKCSKVWERPPASAEWPLAVAHVALCGESRRLAVAAPHGHVTLYRFRKHEADPDLQVIDIPVMSESVEEETSPEPDSGRASFCREDTERRCSAWSGAELRVRAAGGARRAAGYQPVLVALQHGPAHAVTALALHSTYHLMAWAGERGVVVVDTCRRVVLAALGTAALLAPDARQPRPAEAQRSPSIEQAEEASPEAEPDVRRKSSTWKAFNLKRQLSRVDLKLKAAFGGAGEAEAPPAAEPEPAAPPGPAAAPPEPAAPADLAADALEDECSGSDSSTSPPRPDLFERMHRELQEKRPPDVYERMHRELQDRWAGAGAGPAAGAGAGDGPPPRPPRRRDPPPRRRRHLASDFMRRFKPPIPQSVASMEYLHIMQPNDKLDTSFSRSRSSSMSSLENIAQEGIQCLAFADSYIKKSEPTCLVPTLWVGTTSGAVITMALGLPEPDLRQTQPVVVTPSGGPIFRLKGSILAMSFLDCNGALIPYSYENWKDDGKEERQERQERQERRERTPTKAAGSRMSPTPDAGAGDRQFVVLASEKQARVVALPSQNCVYRQQIVDTDFVVKAEIVSLKDSVCLVNYLSTGHLVAYSLPSLRLLVDVDFLPLSELSFQTQSKQRGIVDPMLSIWGQQLIVNEDTDQIAKTFCFTNRGHGLYLASPTEIQKFTIDNEFCFQLNEMLGELFLPRDMPEPPKEGFFRGFFDRSRPLNREELFGESSGKPSRAVARHVAGAPLEQLGARASSAGSEVARAHQLVLERGDKLGQLEDRTERMHAQAGEFSSSAHQLMLKYKDKKWYQL